MSEYWKSTPKYYCKHCKTFVVDTPLSKKNHDASPKHQGALKRFLRDLHRSNEKDAAAAAAAKREVARLNALVGGPSTPTPTPAPTASSSTAAAAQAHVHGQRAATEDERKRQLKELEALGVALPDEARRELAMVGDWTAAAPPVVDEAEGREGETEKEALRREMKRRREEGERERRWEAMDVDERAMRGFSIKTRTYPPAGGAGGGAGFRPMVFGAKGKGRAVEVKKEEVKEEEAGEEEVKAETETGVKVEEEGAPRIKEEETDEVQGVKVKAEAEDAPEIIKKDPEPAGGDDDGIVFKKRKVKNIRKKI